MHFPPKRSAFQFARFWFLLLAGILLCGSFAYGDSLEQDFQRGRQEANEGNFVQARKIWEQLAQRGHARSQYSLGRLYANGDGTRRDFAVARSWFRKAADRGLADAQFALASTYLYGNGTSADRVEALKWFKLAQRNGNAEAGAKIAEIQGAHALPADTISMKNPPAAVVTPAAAEPQEQKPAAPPANKNQFDLVPSNDSEIQGPATVETKPDAPAGLMVRTVDPEVNRPPGQASAGNQSSPGDSLWLNISPKNLFVGILLVGAFFTGMAFQERHRTR